MTSGAELWSESALPGTLSLSPLVDLQTTRVQDGGH
jgi:hypothetical protein